MKKLFVLIGAVCTLSSCQIIRSTATHKAVDIQPMGALIADLEVSPNRISYTMTPHRRVRRGGFKNVKSTAIREALQNNGGGDVLVGLEVQTKTTGFIFFRWIKSVTVSGYPAKYKNFTNPDKNYWTPMGMWLTQDAIQKSKGGKSASLSEIVSISK